MPHITGYVAGDPVVAERPLLSVGGRGAKEPPDGANVAFEGEIVGPTIGCSRLPSDDTFGLFDIDRMQLKALCSNVSHGGSESAPIALAPVMIGSCWLRMAPRDRRRLPTPLGVEYEYNTGELRHPVRRGVIQFPTTPLFTRDAGRTESAQGWPTNPLTSMRSTRCPTPPS